MGCKFILALLGVAIAAVHTKVVLILNTYLHIFRKPSIELTFKLKNWHYFQEILKSFCNLSQFSKNSSFVVQSKVFPYNKRENMTFLLESEWRISFSTNSVRSISWAQNSLHVQYSNWLKCHIQKFICLNININFYFN